MRSSSPLFVFSDNVDGIMARESGRSSKWGAYLDSTLDRIGDAAIFGGLVLYFAGIHQNLLAAGLALACLHPRVRRAPTPRRAPRASG